MTENWLKEKSYPVFTRSKFCQNLIKVSISIYILALNSKTKNISWFRTDVLIDQFPLKSVKGFRKIWRVSIPSKSIKILWQSFWCRFTRSENFVKETFDQVFHGKLRSCLKRALKTGCRPLATILTKKLYSLEIGK